MPQQVNGSHSGVVLDASPTTMTGGGANVLEFSGTEFCEKFPLQGFKIRHQLSGLSEFQLSELAELAQRLPESLVEYYAGDVSVAQRSSQYPKTGLSGVETVRRIEQCRSWMVMKNVEVDPLYNKLLRSLLDEWYGQIDSRQLKILRGQMHREHAYIFISSPNSVTPYHLDDEHNFLLQIRGSKQVNMWDQKDRTVISEAQMESQLQLWHDPDHQRYVPYREEFQERATVFNLNAGEGLHFPFGAPHWVKNGPAVSISFSVTFRSELSKRLAVIYFQNRKLRRMGFEPKPPEQSPWRDSLKMCAFHVARGAAKAVKGSLGLVTRGQR